MTRGGEPGDELTEAAAPSRRRPRRSHVVTYRVRADLKDTSPALWRRLELSSDLFLDEVQPTPEGITFARATLRTWPG